MAEYMTPLIGGLLIGTAALAMMHFLGRIAGIGGITWAAVSRQADSGWRWLFLLGLLSGAFLYHFVSAVPYPAPSDLSWGHTLFAGLLVGFHMPTSSAIDRPLLLGAMLFGLGWGIYGYCPGPALSSLVYLDPKSFGFVAAMLGGMALAQSPRILNIFPTFFLPAR